MIKSMLRGGALVLFSLAMARCGADPSQDAATAPGRTRSALRSKPAPAPGTNAVIELECGQFHVEVTRRTADSESRSRAEDECERKVRRDRPTVECDGCSIRGACEELTRRSEIAMTCEYDDDEGLWECSCGQRTVLGCHPCWDDDAQGPREGCPGKAPGWDEVVDGDISMLQCIE
jgi:hypothetical protein